MSGFWEPREYDNVQRFSELTADFTLAGVVISGRAVERGTGQPMLAAQNQGCHGPGPIMGGRERRIVAEIREQLVDQPSLPTRRRKCLIDLVPSFEHELPVWELRVG